MGNGGRGGGSGGRTSYRVPRHPFCCPSSVRRFCSKMTPLLLLLVTTFGVTVTSCRGNAVDSTRKPGSFGTDVVTAVVDVIKAK